MKKFYYDEILEDGRLSHWTKSEEEAKELGYTESIDEDKVLPAINNLYYLADKAKEKNNEILSGEIRRKRDFLLKQTDKYMIPDFPISEEQIAKVLEYRHALRDITKQESFPVCVIFPKLDI